MEKNIIIFGKNSIIARNFIKKAASLRSNIITISSTSDSKNDLNFNIGKFISTKDINSLATKIKEKLIFRETVFILFSWCGVPRTIDKNGDIWSVNMYIIKNFLYTTEVVNPSRIIFLSSAWELYPKNIKSYKFSEEEFSLPNTSYGRQKLLSEKLLVDFAKFHNKEFTILRISSAYGFDRRFSDQGVINKWLYSSIKNQNLKLFNAKESMINFISFKQISIAILSTLEYELNGIYNIGSCKSITLKEVIESINIITNKINNLEIISNEIRYFSINTKKFYLKTGIKFDFDINKNINGLYEIILSNLN